MLLPIEIETNMQNVEKLWRQTLTVEEILSIGFLPDSGVNKVPYSHHPVTGINWTNSEILEEIGHLWLKNAKILEIIEIR